MTEAEHRPWCDKATHYLTERQWPFEPLGCSSELIEVVSLSGVVVTDTDGRDLVRATLKDDDLLLTILDARELHEFLTKALAIYDGEASG